MKQLGSLNNIILALIDPLLLVEYVPPAGYIIIHTTLCRCNILKTYQRYNDYTTSVLGFIPLSSSVLILTDNSKLLLMTY